MNCIIYSQFSWFSCLSSRIRQPQQNMCPNIQPPFISFALTSWVWTKPAQNKILFRVAFLLCYAKFCFEPNKYFKTWVQCVKQNTFIYGYVSFLGYTMPCPLLFLFKEGVIILYFVVCISVFQLAYFSTKCLI